MECVSGVYKGVGARTLTLGVGGSTRAAPPAAAVCRPSSNTHQLAHVVLGRLEAQVVHLRRRSGERQPEMQGWQDRDLRPRGSTHTLRDTMLLMSGGPRGAPSAILAAWLCAGEGLLRVRPRAT